MRAVHAGKGANVEFGFEFGEWQADEKGFPVGTNRRIIAVGLDPLDLAGGKRNDPAAIAD